MEPQDTPNNENYNKKKKKIFLSSLPSLNLSVHKIPLFSVFSVILQIGDHSMFSTSEKCLKKKNPFFLPGLLFGTNANLSRNSEFKFNKSSAVAHCLIQA